MSKFASGSGEAALSFSSATKKEMRPSAEFGGVPRNARRIALKAVT